MDISVVIPVYGCRKALPELHRRLSDVLNALVSEYEIIYVNDSCPQKSWEEIEKICAVDKNAVGIELSRNFGQMKAILAGLDNCKGDWIVVMDCDLQDKPEEIPTLYAKAQEGYDIVFARRVNRKDNPIKKFFSWWFYKVYEYATSTKYDPSINNFTIVKRNVIENYIKMRECNRSYVIYLKWLGFEQAYVDVEHCERYEGKSSYTFSKRMNVAIDILTSQSDKILRLTAKLGLLMTLISSIMIIFFIVQYFTIHILQGWTSMIIVTFLMGGVILFFLGVIGIYIGNVFMQTKERPLYVIRQVLNGKDQ